MNFIVKNLLVLLSFLFFHSSSNLIDGEIIETKVSFSFFNAGKASMLVDNKIHFVNDLPCYKIDVYGRTTGFFDFFARVRDNWGVYIDTISYTPQKFYKYLQEGKYKKYPFRFWAGNKLLGGYSDQLAVKINFSIN